MGVKSTQELVKQKLLEDSLKITENNITNGFVVEDRMLEKIIDKENIRVALKRVISNKGSHGLTG